MSNSPMTPGETVLFVLLKLWIWFLIALFAVAVTGGLILVVLVPLLIVAIVAEVF
jgi:hypothetical protein